MSTVQLHHELAGAPEAPPLLLGGSLGTTLAMWAPQVAGLADRLRLVAFDHRGHGGSPAPPGPYSIAEMGRDVLALMDSLGLERSSYAGLSIGGMVGIWLAENAPERIDRLVVLCSSAHVPPASNWTQRARAVREAGSPDVIADTVVSRWFTPRWAAENHAIVAAHRAMIANTDAEGYASCCEALASMDLRAGLPGITAPTLVIGGADDPSIPPEHQRAIAAAVPRSRLEIIDDAAHLASVQHPETVNRLIAEHLLG
jgi:3-oxoadipate enol-lactonase